MNSVFCKKSFFLNCLLFTGAEAGVIPEFAPAFESFPEIGETGR